MAMKRFSVGRARKYHTHRENSSNGSLTASEQRASKLKLKQGDAAALSNNQIHLEILSCISNMRRACI